jgi:hypothetical protein
MQIDFVFFLRACAIQKIPATQCNLFRRTAQIYFGERHKITAPLPVHGGLRWRDKAL